MKKLISYLLITAIIFSSLAFRIYPLEYAVEDSIPSAILIEASSGKVLYEKEADTEMIPASVTKVMTMLLIMEAIDSGELSYDDMVTASAKAASMGGSQVYLNEGEQFSVEDMLKSITMASANDACVAMAEHLCGSEEAFVSKMNEKAAELGMKHTNFQNTNGLDDTVTEHYTSARDIAIMSRELINNHPDILNYTSVWMDSVRNGEFGLTNTNRLVRFYKGANGLKTGSTSKAGFCISASAQRDDMQLICVIMKAPDRDTRNEAAKKLLDYGFSNYSVVQIPDTLIEDNKISSSVNDKYDFAVEGYSTVVAKGMEGNIEQQIYLKKDLCAPMKRGDKVGGVKYLLEGKEIYEGNITLTQDVEKIGYFGLVTRLFQNFLGIVR